jgi:hypothetical protein
MSAIKHLILTVPHGFCHTHGPRHCDRRATAAAEALARAAALQGIVVHTFAAEQLRSEIDLNREVAFGHAAGGPWRAKIAAKAHELMAMADNSRQSGRSEVYHIDVHSFPNVIESFPNCRFDPAYSIPNGQPGSKAMPPLLILNNGESEAGHRLASAAGIVLFGDDPEHVITSIVAQMQKIVKRSVMIEWNENIDDATMADFARRIVDIHCAEHSGGRDQAKARLILQKARSSVVFAALGCICRHSILVILAMIVIIYVLSCIIKYDFVSIIA